MAHERQPKHTSRSAPPGADRSALRDLYRRRHSKKRAAELLARYEALIERDGPACDLCGDGEPVEFDHIIPKPAGGTDDLDNLCLAHAYCNKAKGASGHTEARRRLTAQRLSVQASAKRWPPPPWEQRSLSVDR